MSAPLFDVEDVTVKTLEQRAQPSPFLDRLTTIVVGGVVIFLLGYIVLKGYNLYMVYKAFGGS